VHENVIDTGFGSVDYQKQSNTIISNRRCDAHDLDLAALADRSAIKKIRRASGIRTAVQR
jgi:hypothetical protein